MSRNSCFLSCHMYDKLCWSSSSLSFPLRVCFCLLKRIRDFVSEFFLLQTLNLLCRRHIFPSTPCSLLMRNEKMHFFQQQPVSVSASVFLSLSTIKGKKQEWKSIDFLISGWSDLWLWKGRKNSLKLVKGMCFFFFSSQVLQYLFLLSFLFIQPFLFFFLHYINQLFYFVTNTFDKIFHSISFQVFAWTVLRNEQDISRKEFQRTGEGDDDELDFFILSFSYSFPVILPSSVWSRWDKEWFSEKREKSWRKRKELLWGEQTSRVNERITLFHLLFCVSRIKSFTRSKGSVPFPSFSCWSRMKNLEWVPNEARYPTLWKREMLFSFSVRLLSSSLSSPTGGWWREREWMTNQAWKRRMRVKEEKDVHRHHFSIQEPADASSWLGFCNDCHPVIKRRKRGESKA